MAIRVIENFSGEAVILLEFSHDFSCWIIDYVSMIAVDMDGFLIKRYPNDICY